MSDCGFGGSQNPESTIQNPPSAAFLSSPAFANTVPADRSKRTQTTMAHNVALFITCLTDQFYPHVGVAVTKILEHYGCKVCFPAAQTCCGQPFHNNGFLPETAELAKKFIEVFEPCDYIVSPSGSCVAMV